MDQTEKDDQNSFPISLRPAKIHLVDRITPLHSCRETKNVLPLVQFVELTTRYLLQAADVFEK